VGSENSITDLWGSEGASIISLPRCILLQTVAVYNIQTYNIFLVCICDSGHPSYLCICRKFYNVYLILLNYYILRYMIVIECINI
jgi:hypothetical protein